MTPLEYFQSYDEELENIIRDLLQLKTQFEDQSDNLSTLQSTSLGLQRSRSHREKNIQYDPSNLTPFDDTIAGRRAKNRAVQAIEREILLQCAPSRGSSTKTASVAKRQQLLTELCAHMTFENDDFDMVVGKLPKLVREHIELLELIKDRLKSAFSILKKCHGTRLERIITFFAQESRLYQSPNESKAAGTDR